MRQLIYTVLLDSGSLIHCVGTQKRQSRVSTNWWVRGTVPNVESICSENAVRQWLGGRMQEFRKTSVDSGDPNPKEASQNCAHWPAWPRAGRHLNSLLKNVSSWSTKGFISSTSHVYHPITCPWFYNGKYRGNTIVIRIFCFWYTSITHGSINSHWDVPLQKMNRICPIPSTQLKK